MPILTQYLKPDCVKLSLSSTRKVDAIRELAGLFSDSNHITDFRRFLSALLQKEQRFGSGVEKGIALPHYRDESIVYPIVGLGVSREGIDWGDGQKVHILVLVGWPDKHQDAYLKIVAQLASALRLNDIRSRVLASDDPAEIIRHIHASSSVGQTG